ncbi:Cobalamin synthase [Desulfovibrio sp. X2]|uniref:adenosylcobinamide-GDP ribazoletransferase n=1 Tax=Desulfovibrio sp. X2 TaxID=941449 RepID=UPI000358BFAE|nr:adenosylcobinamide-GDP ribazoletransferase [Desulfovibrio sp. X2]EPR43925.1 Cobalamin synthase [Desulfovibrio sp. X2]
MGLARDLRVALAFLSRLAPARAETAEALAASLKVYPLAGLVVGAAALLPARLGLFALHPALLAVCTVALSIWVTRGLHWDGLSDVADAWGSGARGERFWEIMKDSRCGAFAVMGCVLAMLAQAAALAGLLGARALGPALFGFVLGRFLAVGLAHVGRGLKRPGLGGLVLSGAGTGPLLFAAGQTLVLGLWLCPPAVLGAAFGLAALGAAMLRRLAGRQGGLNGDFLGSAVIWGELSAWLAWCLLN